MPPAGLTHASGVGQARKFRLAVVLVVLGVLWWFLLGVLEREARNAEERAANMVIGQLRSALVIKGAEVMLSRYGSLAEHRGINPFELVEYPWGNYEGLCENLLPDPGDWCFRTSKQQSEQQKETVNRPKGWLIYNPWQPITIDRRHANEAQPLAWEVTTEFSDRNGNGVREQEERLTGLRLSPVPLTEEAAQTQDAQR